jgi:homoserine kinase
MSSVRIRVPATTANIGPGFDCLGIALQVYNVVTVSRGDSAPDAMADEAGKAFFRRSGLPPFSFHWKVEGEVPRSRGMGSSVTVRLGILHGLNELSHQALAPEVLYELCAELEGHPDNAAPAAFGGFTIAKIGIPLQRYHVSDALHFVLLIPDFEVATPDARRVLPETITLRDAVISSANAAAIAGAFASSDYDKLVGCFEDRLHQPYREKLIPCLSSVLKAGQESGALGGWLSGSGSTIACLTKRDPQLVAQAMNEASGLSNTRIVITQADNTGVLVLP